MINHPMLVGRPLRDQLQEQIQQQIMKIKKILLKHIILQISIIL